MSTGATNSRSSLPSATMNKAVFVAISLQVFEEYFELKKLFRWMSSANSGL